MESFLNEVKVDASNLEARLEVVKELLDANHEYYSIVKDSQTGEHYLHYAYIHLNVADAGSEEQFHHLMPIDADDVIGFMFGEQPYTYPANWTRAFLRNGPSGFYVWFDPDHDANYDANEELGAQIATKLREFKQTGATNEDEVRQLLQELDKAGQ
ncbi:hypothetical protein NV379_01640 [Paenibacillus sp. N1-5-1-14]|uniref:hypothetical protein n=1 Tax=Paenibacillus radicibacter TaxID=2972488 RepID=UPI00215942CF|nr:hypothetical protein [Paenibacillus radicibacter]MCR8641347.1 hypothetical protein [Paenibacillus radicibacter]